MSLTPQVLGPLLFIPGPGLNPGTAAEEKAWWFSLKSAQAAAWEVGAGVWSAAMGTAQLAKDCAGRLEEPEGPQEACVKSGEAPAGGSFSDETGVESPGKGRHEPGESGAAGQGGQRE